MILSRRAVLASFAFTTPFSIREAHAQLRLRPSLTKESAPDPISQQILSERIYDLNCGARTREEFPAAFDRGFPQLIDQNFAEHDTVSATKLIDNMSDFELADLAQLYVNATSTHGRPEKLPFVLASRLDGQRLGRVARHFGFERIYHAVHSISPEKLQGHRGFLKFADTTLNGPVLRHYSGPFAQQREAGRTSFGIVKAGFEQSSRRLPLIKVAAYTEFLHSSPTQIYQAMRSAKYGSLSVEGAFLEAASIMSGALGRAFGVGYGFGHTVVRPVIEFYMPGFYSDLGDWIGPTIDKMIDAWNFPDNTQKKKSADENGATKFKVGSSVLESLRVTGGDYGSVGGLTVGGPDAGCSARCLFSPL